MNAQKLLALAVVVYMVAGAATLGSAAVPATALARELAPNPSVNGPVISNVHASTAVVRRSLCPGPTTVTIRADVTDDTGLAWVALRYHMVGSPWKQTLMTREAGDTFVKTLGPAPLAGTLAYVVMASDTQDTTSNSATGTVIVEDCVIGRNASRVYLPFVPRNWSPGPGPVQRRPYRPSHPFPRDGIAAQAPRLDLTWAGGDPDGDDVTYDVYLDAGKSWPTTAICDDAPDSVCSSGTLTAGTNYYWRVIAQDAGGRTTMGPVWRVAVTDIEQQETITFDTFPDGTPITADLILDGDEFLSQGVWLAGVPGTGGYSAITSAGISVPPHSVGCPDYTFLTSSLPDDTAGGNSAQVEVTFSAPVRQVRIVFAGASVTYTMMVYDTDGQPLAEVNQAAVNCGGDFEVEYTSVSANIGRITFGREGAVTAIKEIQFQRWLHCKKVSGMLYVVCALRAHTTYSASLPFL